MLAFRIIKKSNYKDNLDYLLSPPSLSSLSLSEDRRAYAKKYSILIFSIELRLSILTI